MRDLPCIGSMQRRSTNQAGTAPWAQREECIVWYAPSCGGRSRRCTAARQTSLTASDFPASEANQPRHPGSPGSSNAPLQKRGKGKWRQAQGAGASSGETAVTAQPEGANCIGVAACHGRILAAADSASRPLAPTGQLWPPADWSAPRAVPPRQHAPARGQERSGSEKQSEGEREAEGGRARSRGRESEAAGAPDTAYKLSTLPHPPTAQPSFGNSVNKGLAAPRVSSRSPSHATITPFDFTSFTTDHQQTWLSQPPSSAATALPSHQHSFHKDFQLFDTDQENQAPANSSHGQATPSTHPSSPFSQRPLHPQFSLQNRISQAQLQSSQSTGYIPLSTNQRSFSSPTLHQQHPFQRQQLAHLRQKPPVPLFSDTLVTPTTRAQTLRPRIQSDSSLFQGADMAFDHLYLSGDDSFASHGDVMLDLDTYESAFTAINTDMPSYNNTRTVSPQELYNDSAISSAPASSAFPNLNTPASSLMESPAMGSSSYNTSPLEDGVLDDTLDYSNFGMPLFPQDGTDQFAQSMPMAHQLSFNSVQSTSASPMVRQRSSPGRPPTTSSGHSRKLSSTSGIAKNPSSKSRKPLPKIEINENDPKEIAKRKKNTAAARKSRQRKQENQEALETEVQRLRHIITAMGGNPDAEEFDE